MFIVEFLHLQLGLSFNSVLTIKDINVIKTIEQKPQEKLLYCASMERKESFLSVPWDLLKSNYKLNWYEGILGKSFSVSGE